MHRLDLHWQWLHRMPKINLSQSSHQWQSYLDGVHPTYAGGALVDLLRSSLFLNFFLRLGKQYLKALLICFNATLTKILLN